MPAEITFVPPHPNDVVAEVIGWLVADGAQVVTGEDVVEIETAKAVTVVSAGSPGVLLQLVGAGDVVAAGSPLALLFDTLEERADWAAGRTDPGPPPAAADPAGTRFSVPALEALRELGLEPQRFAGRGFVTAAEVRAEAEGGLPPEAGDPDLRPLGPAKRTEIERLTAGAAALASALTVSLPSAPVRAALARRPGLRPPILAAVVQAVARAVAAVPELNARVVGDALQLRSSVDVGIAVDAGHGLRVPVVRAADRLDLDDVTVELLELMARYEDRGLGSEHLTGATVTVSDLSGDGILQFQPRINQDQVLAIGIGGDATLPDNPMTITAVFDHRASSGRAVAGLLARIKQELLAHAGAPA